jgi:hypothetical protein
VVRDRLCPADWAVRGSAAEPAGAAAYGLIVYVVVFGNTLFPWFTDPTGPDQGFEIWAHAIFGIALAQFFLGLARRLRT